MNWQPGVIYQEGHIVEHRTPVYDAFGNALHRLTYRVPSWLRLRPLLKRWADRHIVGWGTTYYQAVGGMQAEEPGPDSNQWERL